MAFVTAANGAIRLAVSDAEGQFTSPAKAIANDMCESGVNQVCLTSHRGFIFLAFTTNSGGMFIGKSRGGEDKFDFGGNKLTYLDGVEAGGNALSMASDNRKLYLSWTNKQNEVYFASDDATDLDSLTSEMFQFPDWLATDVTLFFP